MSNDIEDLKYMHNQHSMAILRIDKSIEDMQKDIKDMKTDIMGLIKTQDLLLQAVAKLVMHSDIKGITIEEITDDRL